MTSIETIIELYYQAQKFHLENTDILERYSFEDLAKIYNGIGPDSFPEWLRKVISSLHPSLAPAALIHDVEWHESDKTRDSFSESNDIVYSITDSFLLVTNLVIIFKTFAYKQDFFDLFTNISKHASAIKTNSGESIAATSRKNPRILLVFISFH